MADAAAASAAIQRFCQFAAGQFHAGLQRAAHKTQEHICVFVQPCMLQVPMSDELSLSLCRADQEMGSLSHDPQALAAMLKYGEDACGKVLESGDQGLSLAATAKILFYRAASTFGREN